jgi:hypothetical protein
MTDLALGFHGSASFDDYLSPGSSASARAIASWLARATRYARANASDWRTLAITHIHRIREQYCEEGWDGYAAQPVSAAVARHAIQFVTRLPVYLPAPVLVPEADGEISFDWWFGPNAQFSVSVGSSGDLTYAGIIGKGVKRHGVEPLSEHVPPYILGTIEELVAKFSR